MKKLEQGNWILLLNDGWKGLRGLILGSDFGIKVRNGEKLKGVAEAE